MTTRKCAHNSAIPRFSQERIWNYC